MDLRKIQFAVLLLLGVGMACSCNRKKVVTPETVVDEDTVENAVPDTTVYGICGDGTSMHVLQLVTDAGDSLEFIVAEDSLQGSAVKGGLMAGDRLAVIGRMVDGEMVAGQVLNLTTLLGKWTSIDKNFEIEEGGTVKSSVKAEANPWTAWRIVNGKLVLNNDTFEVNTLGADTLYLENEQGIFAYRRQK